jgi:hypothetical protein
MMLDPFVQVTRVRQSHSPVGLLAVEIMVGSHLLIYAIQQALFKLLSVTKYWLDPYAQNGVWQLRAK